MKTATSVMHVVFSPDSRHLLMDGKDRTVFVYSLTAAAAAPAAVTVKLVRRLSPPPSGAAGADKLRLRPTFGGKGYKFVAMGSTSGSVRIWHWASGQVVTRLPAHSSAVQCVAWSPVDTQLMVSVSDDATVRVWTTPVAAAAVRTACGRDATTAVDDTVAAVANAHVGDTAAA